MKFMDKEGHEFEVANAAELVSKLNKTSHSPETDDKKYMKVAARRIKTQMGCKVRIRTPEQFVEDLLSHHLVMLVSI